MNSNQLKDILSKVKANRLKISDAIDLLSSLPFEDIDFAKLDRHRELRQGYPESVYCPGKTPAQLKKIANVFAKHGTVLIATKANTKAFSAIKKAIPDAIYHKQAQLVTNSAVPDQLKGLIAVVTAGTSDIPIAEEAAITAELMGAKVERIYDVGVAGIHRLLPAVKTLQSARAIVVVAGMEGALPSFVAGLVGAPIIAVPTSTGYGASFKGFSALLGMLNSCATGVAVVNIDNGFGGGTLAALINNPDLYLREEQ